MSELVGQTLGRYSVVGKIGAGGMGEVYRATDTELDRDVAIKVLPEAVASDPSRLERFRREARALAALSHPNLLEVHDIGSTESVHFVVTELLEGETLRERISVSGMSWQKVVEFGAGVADGLAAAHDKGVVHRDLKPENLFVTTDGRIKILDFGLARLQEQVDPEGETGTLTPAGTEAGTIMGTPGYMAPEQIKGQPADARSDIFALGCVLYEMTAGRRAFGGDTGMEVMAAILKEDPPQLSSTTSTVPVDLERTVHRCLEKRPEARFQSAADLAYSLRNIGTGQATPVMATPTAVTPVGEPRRSWWWVGGVATLVIIAVIASWWALTRLGSDESTQAPAFQSMSITPVTSLGTINSVGISPDGRQLAYIRREPGACSIWVRQVATGSEVQVVPPQNLSMKWFSAVDFTPDGEHVVFNGMARDSAGEWSVLRVPTLGGEVRRLFPGVGSLPAFSPDRQRFAFLRALPGRGAALMVADADGSGERELAVGEGMFCPAWSPDGQTIAAMVSSPEGKRPFTFDIDTGARHAIAGDILFAHDLQYQQCMAWPPGGDELLVSGSPPVGGAGRQIWRLSTQEGTLQRITNDPNDYRGVSLSADGTVLATVLEQSVGHLYVAPADDPNSIRQLTYGSRERVGHVDTDGSSVVFQRAPDGQKWELWTCDHDGNDLRRLDTDGLDIVGLRLGISAVRGEVLFVAKDAQNLNQVWRIDHDGKPPLQLTATESSVFGPSLAPDGTWFVYSLETSVGSGNSDATVWKQQTGGGDPVLLATNASPAAVSPDGGHVAIRCWRPNDHGDSEWLYEVIPAEGGAPVISINVNAFLGGRTLWRPDGQALTCHSYEDDLWQVWLQPLDGGPPQQLTHFDHGRTVSHAWSPDGKRLYLVREEVTRDAVLIRDFQ